MILPPNLALKAMRMTLLASEILRWRSKMRAALLFLFAIAAMPFSVLAQDAPWSPGAMFKGVELYSWEDGTSGMWRFSLLPGTNRNKTLEEIKEPKRVVSDVALLKQRLANLAEGEQVFWFQSPSYPELSYPGADVSTDVIKFAAERRVTVLVNK